ncbi:hypothetical protein CUJ84_Chr003591 [Rhizobium leguminosarum]|uniref:Uncharacterized protein n=1 Tax=Rhizobium leguminosarum TaxID=384 RepID=A0A2K9Z6S2_RHILE|nr:hypothetical protein CUJ84_Chr003591 [Rhizobium leguminosarum]
MTRHAGIIVPGALVPVRLWTAGNPLLVRAQDCPACGWDSRSRIPRTMDINHRALGSVLHVRCDPRPQTLTLPTSGLTVFSVPFLILAGVLDTASFNFHPTTCLAMTPIDDCHR